METRRLLAVDVGLDGTNNETGVTHVYGETLGGSGTIAGPLVVGAGGTLAPGNSPGILSTGDFNLLPGSALDIEISGFDSNPGTDYDQVNVTGTVTLAGDLNVIPYGDIFSEESFVIINNDGADAVSGTFNGLAEGATIRLGTTDLFTISYTGGDGNDVVLISLVDARVVTNTNDAGVGSLRAAIDNSNGGIGSEVILFAIPGAGPHTITPLSALPTIVDATRIDGYSQPGASVNTLATGNDAAIQIILDGTSAGPGGDGLTASGTGATGTEIRGLAIGNFRHGISLQSTSAVTIAGNFIGIAPDGATSISNSGLGILLVGNSTSSIGGTDVSSRNLISGNTGDGIRVVGGTSNEIRGNYIGTDASGTIDVGNGQFGIRLDSNTNGNVVGGDDDDDGSLDGETPSSNVISGNNSGGIQLISSDGNTIQGNLIGLQANGNASLANSTGIQLQSDSDNNVIGGLTAGAGNVVSGNSQTGIAITTSTSSGNQVIGNLIGLDKSGILDLGNAGYGVLIDGASANVVGGSTVAARNVISGNTNVGVLIGGTTATGNTVSGNFIGTDASGLAAIPNAVGVGFDFFATNNVVGGATSGERNVIAGNAGAGVLLDSELGNTVIGNFIGVDATGSQALGNVGDGILVNESPGNKIGGTTSGERNIISGNLGSGISISSSTALTRNEIVGNYIGVDVNGTDVSEAIGNADDGINVNSGSPLIRDNVISSNVGNGIAIVGTGGSIDESAIAWFKGEDASDAVGPNDGTFVNGATTGPGINGNALSFDGGTGYVQLSGTQSALDITGDAVTVEAWVNPTNYTQANPQNLQTVFDKYFTNDYNGYLLGLADGRIRFQVATNANKTFVANSSEQLPLNEWTHIAGTYDGSSVRLYINGAEVLNVPHSGNILSNSYDARIGNDNGGNLTYGFFGSIDELAVYDQALSSEQLAVIHTIGGPGKQGAVVQSNKIGLNAVGNSALGNSASGLDVRSATGTLIGSVTPGLGNVVSGNLGDGVSGDGTAKILGNSIYDNGGLGIDVDPDGATASGAPVITSVTNGAGGATVNGILSGAAASSEYRIELFSSADADPSGYGEGEVFLDSTTVTTDGSGSASFSFAIGSPLNVNDDITATATIDSGGTSEFSQSVPVAATLLVTNTNDAGAGSLREAILSSNTLPGTNTIEFDIPGAGPHTIQPLSALPTITDPVVIDGTTEPDFPGTPIIELDGRFTTSGVHGLQITAGNSVVRGLVINRFGGRGIHLAAGDNNVIVGNYIGTGFSGTADLGNAWDGISIESGSSGNLIGGTTPSDRNVISGNNQVGIRIRDVGSDYNRVSGNLIGTDLSGNLAVGNNLGGVTIHAGAQFNIVGTNADGVDDSLEGNVISASGVYSGLDIFDPGTDYNTVAGNLIGTNITGTAALGNNSHGIAFYNGASFNVIGGSIAEARNVISGNRFNGIVLFPDTRENRISGNKIGTDETGRFDLGNGSNGVHVIRALGTIIGTDGDGIGDDLEGNTISGNQGSGIVIDGNRQTVDDLSIAQQLIDGTLPRTVSNGTITETDLRDVNGPGARWGFDNPVPGGGGDEYVFVATGTFNVPVAGTYTFGLGGDDGGRLRIDGSDVVVDDTLHGFLEFFGSTYLTAGTHTFEWTGMERWFGAGWELTVKPGNHSTGPANAANGWSLIGSPGGPLELIGDIDVTVYYSAVEGNAPNIVAGNRIGTTSDGTAPLGNNSFGVVAQIGARNTRIGTNGDGVSDIDERNIISANGADGILVRNDKTDNVVIAGNYVGTDVTGTLAMGNLRDGIVVAAEAVGNLIGTDGDGIADAAERNVIAGNVRDGIRVADPGTTGTVIAGNHVGTDANGSFSIQNNVGIRVLGGAADTLIGTDGDGQGDAAERNVISGNLNRGIQVTGGGTTGTVIAGNYVGTDATGSIAIQNIEGIELTGNSSNTLIGTDGDGIGDEAERNIVSGNQNFGIIFRTSSYNQASGNYVGTDFSGTQAIANGRGTGSAFTISGTSQFNIVGTDGDGVGDDVEGNVISGNNGYNAMWFVNANVTENVFAGNKVGTDPTGTFAVPNISNGIEIKDGASSNRIGTNGDGVSDLHERNIISGNAGSGFHVWSQFAGPPTLNVIAGNFIGTDITGTQAIGNQGHGIFLNRATTNTNSDEGAVENIIGTNGDGIGDDVEGNLISGNGFTGINLNGTGIDRNRIAGNLIGTDVTGTIRLANSFDGIRIAGGKFNTIGTDGDGVSDELERNVVSGNRYIGIRIEGSNPDHNVIAGNLVGTDITGTAALGNGQHGILQRSGRFNRFGTNGDGISDDLEGNVLSGNGADGAYGSGLVMLGNQIEQNVVAGNMIGTDITGTFAIGNMLEGIALAGGASANLFGTNGDGVSDELERNVISGNGAQGIVFWDGRFGGDDNTDSNIIAGNMIGTDLTGTFAIGNASDGIYFVAGQFNLVGSNGDGVSDSLERNIIAGNGDNGIVIAEASNNTIAGNFIGTDVTGNTAIANLSNGVFLTLGASGNKIGGRSNRRNIISGNAGTGIAIDGASAGNSVAGNWVGIGADGSTALSNFKGITINNASGQIIGTNSDGVDDGLEGNVVTANELRGIEIAGNSQSNVIAGNLVGTGPDGVTLVGSQDFGVTLGGNSQNNVVGTDGDGQSDILERNVISGAQGNEVTLTGSGVIGNRVAGNFIGLAADGTTLVLNADRGVTIESGASGNIIGTNSDGLGDSVEGNVIGGMTQMGIRITASNGNLVAGNLIGTDDSGLTAAPNALGIKIENGATGNLIGTDGDGINDAGERNVISGNRSAGILLQSDANTVAGNLIGVAINGTSPLPNWGHGVDVNSNNNIIGSDGDGNGDARERNTISANALSGVAVLQGDGNIVAGNTIGTDASGTLNLGNANHGIEILNSTGTTIGGSVANTIAFNAFSGIAITETASGVSLNNSIRRNSIYKNALLGIDLGGDGITLNDSGDVDTGPNALQNYPVITAATAAANTVVVGDLSDFGPGVYELDFYANPTGDVQGKRHLGSLIHDTTIDGDTFRIDNLATEPLAPTIAGEFVTVTVTDASGNTSEFSAAVETVLQTGLTPTIDEDSLLVSVIPDEEDDGGSEGFLLNDYGVQTRIIPEGQRMRLDGLFADAEADETHTVTIDFGDGTTDQQVFAPGENGFSFEHIYVDDLSSQFDVAVSSDSIVNDGLLITLPAEGGAAIADGDTLTISNATTTQTLEFDSDGLVLPGSLVIPYNSAQTVDEISEAVVAAVEDAFPSSLPANLGDGYVTLLARVITVAVSDGVGSGSTTIGITVQNASPTFDTDGDGIDEPLVIERTDAPGVAVTSVEEGTSVTLSGSFVDSGGQDQLFLSVDWGDGSPEQSVPLAAGSVSFSLVHTYNDDVDPALIRVSLRDDDGGSSEITTTLDVTNVAPTAAITGPAAGVEGTPIELAAAVSDPGNDSFVYTWTATVDGQQVASSSLSQFEFTPIDEGVYTIALVVTDDDGGTVANPLATPPVYTATRTITVSNATPTIDPINPLGVVFDGATVTSVPEGSTVSLTGLFNDLGVLDSHRITIDWGDGSEPLTYLAGQFTTASDTLAGVSHRYADDEPTGTPSDVYTINVTIADGDVDAESGAFIPDGGELSLSTDLTVTNVDPIVRIMENGTDDFTIRLRADVEDPGGVFADLSDSHTFIWTASFLTENGDEVEVAIDDPTLKSIEFQRPTALLVNVSVTATDDDGGEGTNSSTFVGGTSGPDTITVLDSGSGTGEVTVTVGDITATFNPGDQLIVASGGGNDVLNVDTGINLSVNVDLGDGDDSVVSGGGNDILNGGEGADTIVGNDGDDTLISAGDDQLEGGEDNDRYVFVTFSDKTVIDSGGDGDTLDFEQVPQGEDLIDGVELDLRIDDGSIQRLRTGALVSLLGKFENVVGSAYNDAITAGDDFDSTANQLFGGSGDDTILAGGGHDVVDGGDGNDSVFGGGGDDSITSGSGNDRLDGGSGNDSIFGGDGDDSIMSGGGDRDILDGGDGNDSIFGGLGDDSIAGGSGSDVLDSGGGNDSIFGGDGDDTIRGGRGSTDLSGGTGNDSIFGGEGDATIDGGAGNDVIIGGDGNDSIFGGDGDDSISGARDDSVFGSGTSDSIFGGGGDDSIIGRGGDSIDGGEGNDSIFGGGGDGTLSGGGGNDIIVGGDGSDSIFGGEGDDSISGARNETVFGGGGSADSIFGGGGDDTITGDYNGGDTLDGGSGNDSIFGLSGDETIDGGPGNDIIVGGDGIDSIFGGAGDDSIITGGGRPGSNPALDNDSVFGGDGDDTIVGDAGGRDTLAGGDGNDSIFGGGDESIDGGRGRDTIIGGTGTDSIFGGAGDDSIYLGNDPIDTGNDSVFGGDGDDTITGGIGGRDTLAGGDGNDSIFGGGDESIDGGRGNDTIVGGTGNDSIFGGDGDDSIQAGSPGGPVDPSQPGNDSIFGGAGDDTIIGDGYGADTLIGDSGNDSIFGGGGDETIDGGIGNDTLRGNGGSDSIFGGEGDDSISAGDSRGQNPGNDSVFGGDGDDTITGNGGGRHTLSGDAGNDSIFGGIGDETIIGGIGHDTLVGNSGHDSIFGGQGDDSIDAGRDDVTGSGNDSIFGGDGDDTISGDGDGADILDGGEGFDSIFGGAGDESIYGGPGNDTLGGGSGNDSIFGGTGLVDEGTDYVISISDTDMRLTPDRLFHGEGTQNAFSFQLSGIEKAALIGGENSNFLDATEFSGGALLAGGPNDDTLLGGTGADTLEGGGGNDSLVGGSGADQYLFVGKNLGQDVIDESPENHGDHVDLFGFNTGYGVEIDLSQDGEQVLQTDPVTGATLTSVQWAANSLEGAVGTVYGDRIRGSENDDRLSGGGGIDSLDGGAGDDVIYAGIQRYVFLDFDSATDGDEHVYTPEERALIESEMRRDYALFDVVISTDLAYIEGFGQPYVTVRFNDAPIINGVPSPGGVSERIGWRLLERGGTVRVNVNGFFGDGSNQLPPDNNVADDNIEANLTSLSTTIASHELGHMYGLRHVDSLGAPGQGIFGGLSERAFLPTFEYLDDLGEAARHMMASPASIGSALIDAVGNPFFGEREAVKLAFLETGQTVLEELLPTANSAWFDSVRLLGELPALAVPNPVEQGVNVGIGLQASAINVVGEIRLDPNEGTSENDVYAFESPAGKVTIEVLSFTLRHRIEERIDSLLRVYDSTGQKLDYFGTLGAFNDDGFEGSDSVLIDVTLPEDGTYYIEVDTFSFTNNPELEQYAPIPLELIDRIIELNPDADSVKDTDTGGYELFVYRFDNLESFSGNADPGTIALADPVEPRVVEGDMVTGGEGADTLFGTSGNDMFFADPFDSILDPSGTPNISLSVDEGSVASLTLPLKQSDDDVLLAASIGEVTNNNDGTWTWTYVPGDGPDETQAVTVTTTSSTGTSDVTFNLTVNNVAPTIELSGAPSVNEGATYTLNLGPITDPGDDEVFKYIVRWGDGSVESFDAGGEVTHTFADGNGNSIITVDLVDEDGAHFGAGSLEVMINNVAPTIVLGGASNVFEGASYTLNLGSIIDPGSDTVTTYIVDWGDGSSNTYDSGGDVTHTYANGPADVVISVDLIDEDGTHESAGTFALTIDNANPVAVDDPEWPALYTTDEDSPVTISSANGVLANDSDPGIDDRLTVTEINGREFNSGETIALPSGAKLTVYADGAFEYDPDGQFDYLSPGESDTDSFEYTVSDGEGGFATATAVVTVTGLNDAPTILGGPDAVTIDEVDSPLTIEGSFTVIDVDVTDTVLADHSLSSVVMNSGRVDPAAPTQTELEAMLSLDPVAILGATETTNTLSWTFDSGSQTFDYLGDRESLILTYEVTVKDSFDNPASERITVTINGFNDSPEITLDSNDRASLELQEGGQRSGAGTLTVTDLDTIDAVTASLVSVTESGVGARVVDETTLLSMLTLNNTSVIQSGTNTGKIGWIFDRGDETFSHLPDGQSLTLTYTVQATDDSGATVEPDFVTQTIAVTITGINNLPTAETERSEQTQQYSDRIDDIHFTFRDADREMLGASIAYRFKAPDAATFGEKILGLPDAGSIDGELVLSEVSKITDLGFVGTWTIAGIADLEPGTYLFEAVATDGSGATATSEATLEVRKEDAVATYSGAEFVSTGSARESTATVELRATIQDISAILDPSADPDAGNITTARVSFLDMSTGEPLRNGKDGPVATGLPITLVDVNDQKVGVAAFTWETDIGNADSETYDIIVKVDNYYDNSDIDSGKSELTAITISKPLDDAVTGGGHLVNLSSEGLYAGDPGKKTNFGFNIKTNKRGTNIQGNVNIIIRRDGRVYQIKTNATNSLAAVESQETDLPQAEFSSKASLRDITNPNNPISLGGNLQLLATITDGGDSGSPDRVAFTLWDDATLLYSSYWTGTVTDEQALNGGDVQIRLDKPQKLRLAKNSHGSSSETSSLSEMQLESATQDAIAAWSESGISNEQLGRLAELDLRIADLEGETLGAQSGNVVWIDDDAAGFGWNLDGSLGQVDLVSVLAHEFGHALGLDHDVMGARLAVGTRDLAWLEESLFNDFVHNDDHVHDDHVHDDHGHDDHADHDRTHDGDDHHEGDDDLSLLIATSLIPDLIRGLPAKDDGSVDGDTRLLVDLDWLESHGKLVADVDGPRGERFNGSRPAANDGQIRDPLRGDSAETQALDQFFADLEKEAWDEQV